jgi:hypothetical protein
MGGTRVIVGGHRLCRESRQVLLDSEHGADTLSTSQVIPPSSYPASTIRGQNLSDRRRARWRDVAFLNRKRINAVGVEAASESRFGLMASSLAQIRVRIECTVCGTYQELAREVILPFEVITPMFERTHAVCERCRRIAVMCFDRSWFGCIDPRHCIQTCLIRRISRKTIQAGGGGLSRLETGLAMNNAKFDPNDISGAVSNVVIT